MEPPRSSRGVAGLLNRNQQGSRLPPMPPSLQAKLTNMARRNNNDVDDTAALLQQASLASPSSHNLPPNFRTAASYPSPNLPKSATPAAGGIAARRRSKPNFSLKDINGNLGGGASAAGLGQGRPSFAANDSRRGPLAHAPPGSLFSSFANVIDPNGRLNFKGKAVLHANGVNFANGVSFQLNMEDLERGEELGRGNYGTVTKVLHTPTGVTMALKEIRLELDNAKLNAIIMELDILHRAASSSHIVDFYGAFFVETCVYYCMEYMDRGSLDTLVNFSFGETVPALHPGPDGEEEVIWQGVPEDVLARIAGSTVKGLKFLKDELGVIHRDVKPTNVLINNRGQIKLCDFGVSGQLEKSIAKTNIGCQTYMAPERISGEHQNTVGTYTVSSDVWSLGLSIIEIAIGRYPYPPEAYSNILAQLKTIIQDDAPTLPTDRYSPEACDWVASCLVKVPDGRATYAELLGHEFIQRDEAKANAENGDVVDMAGWLSKALQFREAKIAHVQALAAAALAPSAPPGHPVLSAPATTRIGLD
ncbi:kinase-like protein [Lentinula lateritia]|uniref:Kinase-like protein n=1 Tax=Lentinula aff. lateritia TaxID=2804960 RepID=A0ACC1U2D4_9AGAR|nr:kinase-like protein [Lentinula aff. lateritia]KAJ3852160.1 kinase-like protein [Lentinula lateritia]